MSKQEIKGFYTKREKINIEVDVLDEYYNLRNFLDMRGLVYISENTKNYLFEEDHVSGYYREISSYDYHKGEYSITGYELIVPESDTKKFELYRAFDIIYDAIKEKEEEKNE